MKKQILVVLLALVLAFSMVSLIACVEPEEPATYALTYAAGEGSGTAPAAQSYEAGAKVTLKAANTFTAPEGKEFDKWSDGTATYAAGAEYTMPAKAVTLTAQWKSTGTVTPSVTLSSISATYEGTIEVNGSIDSAKLTVTASYSDETSKAVTGYEIGSIDAATAGDKQVTITYTENGVTKTCEVTITVVAAEPDNSVTLYFYNSDGWETVNVHAWVDQGGNLTGEWPGIAATAVDGHEGWVQATIEADLATQTVKVIFNGGGTQTGNLTITAGNLYFIKTGGYASYEAAEAAAANPPELPKTTLYFYNSENWASVYAHAWIDGGNALDTWPGIECTAVDGHANWVQVTFEVDAAEDNVKVIFNNNDGTQTGNLNVDSAKLYYIYAATDYAYAGFEAAEAAAQPAITPNAAWVGTYTVIEDEEYEYELEIAIDSDGKTLSIIFDEDEAENIKLEVVSGKQQITFDIVGTLKTSTYIITLNNDGSYSFDDSEYYFDYTIEKQVPAAQKYTVTFIKSTTESQIESVVGDVPAAAQVAEGSKITMPAANTLTLAHYTLTSWRVYEFVIPTDGTDAYWAVMYEDGKAVNIAPGAEYTMPGKNIQIKAVWTQNQVTVSFDANGGTGTMTPITKNYNNYLNYTNIACAFTAPAGMQFAGWALSANGYVLTQDVKMSEIASDEDTVTLYAIWKSATVVPTTPLIDDIKGSWSATGHTIDIIAGIDAENEYVVGYAVLDGKYYLVIVEDDGEYYAYSLDGSLGYDITLSDGTLTLTPYEGVAIALSGKTALTNAARATFEGNWVKSNVAQKWIITADEVYYGVTDLKTASTSMVIGNYIVITYEQGSTSTEKYIYTYVLAKQGDNLEGWYVAPGASPVAETFVPGNYLTLIVDGKLNQVVTTGQAPDASKIIANAPEGKAFSKWVIVGTETEFDVTAAMTESIAIEAVYVDSTTNVSKLYAGSVVVEYGSFAKKNYTIANFVINFETLEASCDDGSGWQLETTIRAASKTYMNTSVYGADASYYEVNVKAVDNQSLSLYIIVNADQTKITLCNSENTPYEGGEYVLSTEPQTSPWADLSALNAKLAELCAAGTKLYFEDPISHENNSFLGIQFTTFSGAIAIQVLYVNSGAEKAGTTLATVVESGNLIRIKTGSGNYSYGTVFALDKNGDLYVTSFYYKSFYNVATKLGSQTEETISLTPYNGMYDNFDAISMYGGYEIVTIEISGNEQITFRDDEGDWFKGNITEIKKVGESIVVTFEYGDSKTVGTITFVSESSLTITAEGSTCTFSK